MKNKKLSIDEETFWEILCQLESLVEEINLQTFITQFGHPREKVLEGITYLNSLEFAVQIVHDFEGQVLIRPPAEKLRIKCEFSLLEWLAMQALQSELQNLTFAPYQQYIIKKLAAIEENNPAQDLLTCELIYQSQKIKMFDVVNKGHLETINHSIKNKITLKITKNNELYEKELYPHKVTQFEDHLNLIAEDCGNFSMVFLPFESIKKIYSGGKEDYKSHFSPKEVESFVDAMLSMDGKAIRIVLKFKGMENISFDSNYHYLGKPFLASNASGEIIWSATVGPSEEFFLWLSKRKDSFEVLSPLDFKKDFEEYCQKILFSSIP